MAIHAGPLPLGDPARRIGGPNGPFSGRQARAGGRSGLEAEHWEPLGTVDVNSGITSDVQHLYRATGLRPSTAHHDAEEKIDVAWHPFEHAVEMVMSGQITEVCSVAAILKVARLKGL